MRCRPTWHHVCWNNYRKPIDARHRPRHEGAPARPLAPAWRQPACDQRADHARADRHASRSIRGAGRARPTRRQHPDPSLSACRRSRRGGRRPHDPGGRHRLFRAAAAGRQRGRAASGHALAGQGRGRLAHHAMPLQLRAAAGRDGPLSARRGAPFRSLEGARRAPENRRRRGGLPVRRVGAGGAARQRGRRLQRLGWPPPPDALPRHLGHLGIVHPRARRRPRLQVRNPRPARPAGEEDRSLRAADVPAPRDHQPRARGHGVRLAGRRLDRRARRASTGSTAPISIYEVHLGSWRRPRRRQLSIPGANSPPR